MRGTILSLWALVACSETGFSTVDDVDGHLDTAVDDGIQSDPGDDGPTMDTGDPASDDPTEPDGPPEDLTQEGDCEGEGIADWADGEISVWASGNTESSGELTVDVEGYYHIYDTAIAESGSSQMNETAFLRVKNATNPEGLPKYANCESDWVAVDPDNEGAVKGRVYLGTFWVDAGVNTVELHHWCPYYLDEGWCPDLHIDSDSSSCDSSSPNSVHFNPEGMCLTSEQ